MILGSHFANLKMHHTHTHHKLLQKWVSHANCNLLPHITPPQVAVAHWKSCFDYDLYVKTLDTRHPLIPKNQGHYSIPQPKDSFGGFLWFHELCNNVPLRTSLSLCTFLSKGKEGSGGLGEGRRKGNGLKTCCECSKKPTAAHLGEIQFEWAFIDLPIVNNMFSKPYETSEKLRWDAQFFKPLLKSHVKITPDICS